jgi:hypothetical protein
MSTNSAKIFSIEGYEDSDFKKKIGLFQLQVAPDKFDISFGQNPSETSKNVNGDVLVAGSPGKELRDLSFSFLIDNSGVFPQLPSGCNKIGSSIMPAVNLLNKITVLVDDDSHTKPFVWAIWSDLQIQGRVSNVSYNYSFFNENGEPIRASVSMQITEIATEKPTQRSPDISRMPSVKDGDNLVKFCEDFYDDKNFYLKIAELNNLSSFRALDRGKRLEFPPIKK